MGWIALASVMGAVYLFMGLILVLTGKDFRSGMMNFPKIYKTGWFLSFCGGLSFLLGVIQWICLQALNR